MLIMIYQENSVKCKGENKNPWPTAEVIVTFDILLPVPSV